MLLEPTFVHLFLSLYISLTHVARTQAVCKSVFEVKGQTTARQKGNYFSVFLHLQQEEFIVRMFSVTQL